jgi:hypothetical protein
MAAEGSFKRKSESTIIEVKTALIHTIRPFAGVSFIDAAESQEMWFEPGELDEEIIDTAMDFE